MDCGRGENEKAESGTVAELQGFPIDLEVVGSILPIIDMVLVRLQL